MSRRVLLSLTGCGLVAVCVLTTRIVPAQPPGEPALARAAKETIPNNPMAATAKAASSRVTAVTVYPNSALVTREVDVPEGQGAFEVIVTPLPPQTVNSSLYTEGTDGIRVLATRFRTRQLREDTREEVRKLQDEIEQLQFARERLEAESRGVQTNMQLLAKLEGFTTASTTHAAEKGALNSESAIALAKYIMDNRLERSKELVGIQQQVKLNLEKAEFAQRKLTELSAGSRRTEQDAVIVVDKANAGAGKVRLNYLVDAASWRPQYKLRAGKSAKEPVQLEYIAAIIQQTGEDWANVKLVLSTAQPTLNAAPPDLQVLQVTTVARGATTVARPSGMELEEQVRTLRNQAQKDINEKKAASGAGLFNTAAALDQSWELLNPEAAVKRGCALAVKEGPSVTYHLNTALTVPSRRDEQVIEVARIDMVPDYYYKAVPVLTSHVYRQADLTNKSNYVLLPGEATMYQGTDFVGQMNLPLVAIGEQFTVGFGVDPQLQIQRAMTDRSRATQGGNQVLRFEYRILLGSYKSEPVKVQVWDRLPHPENDAVGVSLIRTAPEVCKDAVYLREQRPNNLLRWDVTVNPGMNGEKALALNYEFKIDLDRQMSLGSFQTAGGSTPLPPPTRTEPTHMGTTVAALPHMPAVGTPQDAKIKAALAKLSPEDRKLAETQVFCAVDHESPLGSMGPILKVMCKGKPVFLCCKGCEKEAQQNPDGTLKMLDQLIAKMAATPRK